MHTFKKILMFVASSFVVVIVGLAVLNRLSKRVPALNAVLGA